MKTKHNPLLLAALAVTILLPIVASAQVKIPSKSGSSLDDSKGSPTGTQLPPSSGSSFDKKSNVSKNAPAGPTTLVPSNITAPKPGSVTAVQRVPMPKQNLDPAKQKRLAELRRELNISESATKAFLSLPADELFEKTAPTTIENLSVPTLKKVLQFIELNDKKGVTVNPLYVADEENGKQLAWARSLSLIEWFGASSDQIDRENFKVSSPLPVTEETPKKVAKNLGEGELVNRIDLLLEFKNPAISQ